MTDEFRNYGSGLTAPGRKAFAITPHDTNELAIVPRGLYVGVSGDVAMILVDDTEAVTFYLVAGVAHPLRPKVVLATGTTATGIVGVHG